MFRMLMRSMVVGAALVALTMAATPAADEKVPSIHDIMHEGHSGKKSLLKVLTASVKAEKWPEAEKPAMKMKEFGEAIGKNTPEKGTPESWQKFSKEYKASTSEIAAAVKKKDKLAANQALAKFSAACKGCHSAHRP